MAFRRSPVRTRSGPPAFARPSGELRLGRPASFPTGEGCANPSTLSLCPSRRSCDPSPSHRTHPAGFETSAFGMGVAPRLACRRTRDSSTYSRMPIRRPASTSVGRLTSPLASLTTAPAAALTPRATVPGSFTSSSNFLTSSAPWPSSATSNPAPAVPSRSDTSGDASPLRPAAGEAATTGLAATNARSGKSGCARCCGVVLGTRPDSTACTR